MKTVLCRCFRFFCVPEKSGFNFDVFTIIFHLYLYMGFYVVLIGSWRCFWKATGAFAAAYVNLGIFDLCQ